MSKSLALDLDNALALARDVASLRGTQVPPGRLYSQSEMDGLVAQARTAQENLSRQPTADDTDNEVRSRFSVASAYGHVSCFSNFDKFLQAADAFCSSSLTKIVREQ